jgi:hypothetical protein
MNQVAHGLLIYRGARNSPCWRRYLPGPGNACGWLGRIAQETLLRERRARA